MYATASRDFFFFFFWAGRLCASRAFTCTMNNLEGATCQMQAMGEGSRQADSLPLAASAVTLSCAGAERLYWLRQRCWAEPPCQHTHWYAEGNAGKIVPDMQ